MRRNNEAFLTFGFKASASLLYCGTLKKLNSCKRFQRVTSCVPITKTNMFTVTAKQWFFVLRLIRHKTWVQCGQTCYFLVSRSSQSCCWPEDRLISGVYAMQQTIKSTFRRNVMPPCSVWLVLVYVDAGVAGKNGTWRLHERKSSQSEVREGNTLRIPCFRTLRHVLLIYL